MTKSRGHVVIVVVNLPVERDRRVIRECLALEEAGYRVTVICPRGSAGLTRLPGSRSTDIRSFPQPLAGSGVLSFAFEFAWALLAVTTRLLGLMLRTRVDAVQACNPPDVFWVLAVLLRAMGKPFVFDHHDLSPELYECKTDTPNPRVLAILKWFEKMSWRRATAVVSTNESYRDLAISRGGLRPDKVVVVRNGPTIAEVAYRPDAPRSGPHTIVYLGVINPQDHVDAAVLAAEQLIGLRGDTDWRLVVAGDGECLPGLRELATARNLDRVVEFRGWLEADEVDALLNSATVAVQPDPPTKMAELSTMAKTVEYVARGLPVVAVDLLETRRTAEGAALYVPTGSPDELAKALDLLLSDAAARASMSEVARRRFVEQLAWDHQAKSYIRLWDRLLGQTRNGYKSGSPVGGGNRPASPRDTNQTVS
ncbi:glycosyltransferase family 4 protein [Asanoa sp. WMMD1127]|uniref:glycosyltransferase family 4 protein n=1 Tax=Asanoa sp. WMMD1127 TaxID=3016107 RepID=UPI002417EF53|nr:glycosyltransferase family 4 protein [Asanoa sp. WMMD1127]MDG4823351.1 glycosyltransferase family 4 protein [Asanoa sp. WMMD1127]